jgi:hypothetical protein
MAGRPRALDDAQESLLVAVVDAGLPVGRAALALGVSARTASRVLARRSAEGEPLSLDELIALAVGDPVTILGGPRHRGPARQRLDWRASAALLEQLEAEDWGDAISE